MVPHVRRVGGSVVFEPPLLPPPPMPDDGAPRPEARIPIAPPELRTPFLPPREADAIGFPMPGRVGVDSSPVFVIEVLPPIDGVLLMDRPIPELFIADPAVVSTFSALPIPDLFM